MYQDLVKSDLRHLTIVQRISQTHVDTYLTSQQLLATSGHMPNCRSGDAHVYVYIYIYACVCACVLYINIQACNMFLYVIMCTLSIYVSRNITFSSEPMSPRPFFRCKLCLCQLSASGFNDNARPGGRRLDLQHEGHQEMGPQKFHLFFSWIFWCIWVSLDFKWVPY